MRAEHDAEPDTGAKAATGDPEAGTAAAGAGAGAEARAKAKTEPGSGAAEAGTKDEPRAKAEAGPKAEAGAEGAAVQGAKSRRFPSVTQDTARPEGAGRAGPGDALAARQWPMLSVLAATAIGLLLTALGQARVGCLVIGVALIAAAVLRRVLPDVGMLAVRSRFTDMITYGLLGASITLLALVVAAPKPWLDIPFLEDAVRFTVR
ncbi:DUF3017 domain-containing protein [Streptomyces sp. NPDC090445]|uniref:DUF3017 domain-containing protein n=1 Tax=Streptomyces sp. NPDC090445 TaxID=3365963 RepID=UPI00380AF7EE